MGIRATISTAADDRSMRLAGIVLMLVAVGMFAFTQARATKVETQYGKPEAVQRFHGVEDDFVVQRSAE